MFLFSPQVSSFWQCPGISRPGFRPGLRHSDRHRPGHRVPHVQSGEPLGSVDVDTSSRAGGARRCWAHQRSLHWWVWAVRVGTRTPSGHPPTGIQTETTVIFISMIINIKILLSKVQWEGQTKTHYAFGHSTAAVHWVLLVLALSIWCWKYLKECFYIWLARSQCATAQKEQLCGGKADTGSSRGGMFPLWTEQ